MRQEYTDGYSGGIESRIIQEMEKVGSCTLDELVLALPDYNWQEVFIAVDRLRRSGALTLRHPNRFKCVVEVGLQHAT